ncbi:MAG: hypothetical protein B6U89_07565 [Desulfurococcales archaeon ex4484_58]|nr:MAG: hypothetical protein B6U89_07565 [Desulfurococcales archaeon ex4484_58]
MRKLFYSIIEGVDLGVYLKPIQKSIRFVLSKHGIQGSRFDRRVSGIIYNVFRNLGLIDHIIETTTGFKSSELNRLELSFLRVTTYLVYLDKHRVSRSFLRDLRRYGLKFLVENNVETVDRAKWLYERIIASNWKPRTRDEEIMYKYKVSPRLYQVLNEAFDLLGEDIDLFLRHTLKPPVRVFRVNSLKSSVDKVIEYLRSKDIKVEQGLYSRSAIRISSRLRKPIIDLVEKGVLIPQDEASIVAVELMDLGEDMDIADLCAAPGGKTTYIAELTRLNSRVFAFELYPDRAKRLKKLLKRTGTSESVLVYTMDARRAYEILGDSTMDRVLIDPPCSSTGALAKNPDVRWRFERDRLGEINKLQYELLETGWRILKPNGKLLYTVCSVLPSEGEFLVKKFLDRHNDAKLLTLNKPFKESPLLPGTIRSYPHIHNVTGFFYALIEKKP